MTDSRWQLIDDRKILKQTADNSTEYSRVFRNSCRKDKNDYISHISEEIDQYGRGNESRGCFQKVPNILEGKFEPKS